MIWSDHSARLAEAHIRLGGSWDGVWNDNRGPPITMITSAVYARVLLRP